MLSETLQVLTQVAMLVFVVGSMAAMGLGLTPARITQPLRDVRLVVGLLLVNFVVVPAAAIAAARLLPHGGRRGDRRGAHRLRGRGAVPAQAGRRIPTWPSRSARWCC